VAGAQIEILSETLSTAESASPVAQKPTRKAVSVVIPLYNEEKNVPILYDRLMKALEPLGRPFEVIFVNDGSQDTTSQLIAAMAERNDNVLAIDFKRRFGQTAAMTAGIDYASGDVIICMDGDLQNDPADIGLLLSKLDEGFDVVCGWREKRKDPFIRTLPSRIANMLISRISGVRLHDYGCTLKAFRHEFAKEIRLYGEMHRFIPIYASWQGARITEIPVNHHPRTLGKSNYGLERTIKVVLDLMVVQFLSTYSTKPIYLFGGFGMVSCMLSMITGLWALVLKLLPGVTTPTSWHKDLVSTPLPVVSVGLFVVGIQMILIGLLAEVQVRTYYESQGKTIYAVKNVRGRGASAASARRAEKS
jgi:glycosyltransferase involved in cell wall biosynthesis